MLYLLSPIFELPSFLAYANISSRDANPHSWSGFFDKNSFGLVASSKPYDQVCPNANLSLQLINMQRDMDLILTC